jgi:hypothetical protein
LARGSGSLARKGKTPSASLLLFVASCGAASGGAVGGEEPSGEAAPAVAVAIAAQAEGPWRVDYRLARPVERLDLGPALDGFRRAHWRPLGGDVRLIEEDGRNFFVAKKSGGRFDAVSLRVTPRSAPLAKDYQAFTPMGEGGLLLYTGHFTPKTEDRALLDAVFTIEAPKGGVVSAFDCTAAALDEWRSPYGLPAFVYVGSERPVETQDVAAIVDARAPDWVKKEMRDLTPALFRGFASSLDRRLPTRPNLFVAMGDTSIDGQISYRGDALPGQFQATLVGGAWVHDDAPEARDVLLYTTAHEVAHLFQLTAGSSEGAPNFIHEGGADALAAEALVRLGRWTPADAANALGDAKAECASLTEGRSLLAAERAAEWRAPYACGHVLTVAAAGKAGPAAFWRRLIVEADEAGGYSETLYLKLAGEMAGRETAEAIAGFLRTNAARPDLVLDGILASGRGEP